MLGIFFKNRDQIKLIYSIQLKAVFPIFFNFFAFLVQSFLQLCDFAENSIRTTFERFLMLFHLSKLLQAIGRLMFSTFLKRMMK